MKIVLAIALTPFLFWGLESYQIGGGPGAVAVVDGEDVSRQEFEQAMRNQQENLRNMLGDNLDPSILDNPQMRFSVLENLIQQKLLGHEANRIGLAVLESRLTSEIQNISFFHEDDQFSFERYQELLRRQGMSPAMFEARMASELMRQQLLEGITESSIISSATVEKIMSLSETQYEINRITVNPDQYLNQVEPDEAAIQAYYDEHRPDFILPERVRVEYVVLSLDDLAQQEFVSDEEIKEYYDERQDEFGQPEERRASHILLTVPSDATEEEKAEIRERAEQILAQVEEDSDKFEELATEFSNDPGSAKKGGDLGYFGRGLMVKTFEDEVFQMQQDEIRGPVESPFGYHVIKLTGVKNADVADFDKVKAEIKQTLQQQKASARFAEVSEDFSNIVYEQSDTLSTAADMFNLSIQQSDWIDRRSKEPELLTGERMLQAIFSESTVQDKFNTEAIEVKRDIFVAARVLEHRAASAQSVELVKDEIVTKLKQQMAAEMAEQDGEKKLTDLRAGNSTETSLNWGEPVTVSYSKRQGLPESILRTLLQTDTEKLPAYAGVAIEQGDFNLIRINQVTAPTIEDESSRYQLFADQLRQARVQEELNAYVAGLRQRYDVTIKLDDEDD